MLFQRTSCCFNNRGILFLNIKRYYALRAPLAPIVPQTDITVLKNKIKVAAEETNGLVTTIGLFIKAGPRYETPERNGITHFIEHLAYKSFKKAPRDQFESWVTINGIKLKSYTARDHVGFYATCLQEHTDILVNIFTDILFEREFSKATIDEEKIVLYQELEGHDHNCKRLVFQFLHQTAYQGTPLSQTITGPTKNFEKFDEKECYNYIYDQFQPQNIVLASSGPLSHNHLLNLSQNKFETYQANPCHIRASDTGRYTGSEINYRNDTLPFAHVAIAIEAPGFVSSDYITLLVASSIIGSWNRSQGGKLDNASILAQAMSTLGYCEHFESFYIAYEDTGLWGIYFIAGGLHLDDVVEFIQDQWMHLCASLSIADVERGINTAKLKIAKRVAGSEKSCKDIGIHMLYMNKRRSTDEYFKILSTINISTVMSAANTYIYDKCPVVAAVGPTEALPEYTRLRANMYWLKV